MNSGNLAKSNSESCGESGAFQMTNCKENLPDLDTELPKPLDNISDDEYTDAKDFCDNDELDDEAMAEKYKDFSDEQLEKLKLDAVSLKSEGNDFFKKLQYEDAINKYTEALNSCPLKYKEDRSVLFSNRAAAKLNLDMKEEAVLDCNKALDLNPNYLKAVLRRAQLHKKLDNLDRSLEDYKKVLELDKNNDEARYACATMPAEIAEKNEKLKQEMFGKLKELGNLCLRPFGLSTDNFKVVQDPNTGGYSVNFQNNT